MTTSCNNFNKLSTYSPTQIYLTHDTLTMLCLKFQRLMHGIHVGSLQCVLNGNGFYYFYTLQLVLIALMCSLIVCFINKLQFKL